jgi:hypothetical protein
VTDSPTTPPLPSATVLEPDLLDLVLHHDELSLAAKTVVVYVLTQPRGHTITRAELEELGRDATPRHLDALLHELVAAHWFATVPAVARPCCADTFLLREDHDPDDDQAPGDSRIHAGPDGGGGNDDGVRVAHLDDGVTWVTGDHGSDGRG